MSNLQSKITQSVETIDAASRQTSLIDQADKYGARNYLPLPVVLTRGEGIWVWDSDGKRYMDCLSAYSAVNQGHRHPHIIKALKNQADRLTLTSRAFHNDRMGPFLSKLCHMSQMEKAVPMKTGAEAVETAIKTARKWGYQKKGVADNQAEIIVCKDNFHGRTTTITGFSSEAQYKQGFGPFTPGFVQIDYGDSEQLELAINANTVAFLVEPIQGEAGIHIPPAGYLTKIREICSRHNILLMFDEIQTGLGRTGELFCYQHEAESKPDVLIVGKALAGGVYPVSATLTSAEIMAVYNPGDHGSTFGGNPLGAAVAQAALQVIEDESLVERSKELGSYLLHQLNAIESDKIQEIRGRGLFVGIELKPEAGGARIYCERLMELGLLAKETHEHVIRIAPPLVISKSDLDWVIEQVRMILE